MKKLYIVLMVFCSIGTTHAQIANFSFESWRKDTNATNFQGLPVTIYYEDPVNWTSLNQVSNANVPPFVTGKIACKKDTSDKFDSSTSVRLKTEQLSIPIIGNLNVPGVIINGKFTLNNNLITGGGAGPGNPDFLMTPGFGSPINSRPKAVYGYYKYIPNGTDTAEFRAVLKKGNEMIADFSFKPTQASGGWVKFYLPFNYGSCTVPDSIVVAFSTMKFRNFGTTNGKIGSTLWIDSIGIDSLDNFSPATLPPNAVNDFVNINCLNQTDIDFLGNDFTCNLPVKYTYLGKSNINAGTALVIGSGSTQKIRYTPNYPIRPRDTLAYTICDTVSKACDTAYILVTIRQINNKLIKDMDTTLKNAAKSLNVMSNDTLSNCMTSPSLFTANAPKHGKILVVANASITYTPDSGYFGSDSFNYKICSTINSFNVCDSSSVYIYVKNPPAQPNAINVLNNQDWILFPNPASSHLMLNNIVSKHHYDVYNMVGILVMTIENIANQVTIDIDKLNNGTYSIVERDDNNRSINLKKFSVVK